MMLIHDVNLKVPSVGLANAFATCSTRPVATPWGMAPKSGVKRRSDSVESVEPAADAGWER